MKFHVNLLCSCLLGAMIPAARAVEASAVGTIASLHSTTVLQPNGGVQDVITFALSVPLANGCNGVWITPSDHNPIATALAAKLSSASVTIYYDNSLIAPWGETDYCGLLEIDLN